MPKFTNDIFSPGVAVIQPGSFADVLDNAEPEKFSPARSLREDLENEILYRPTNDPMLGHDIGRSVGRCVSLAGGRITNATNDFCFTGDGGTSEIRVDFEIPQCRDSVTTGTDLLNSIPQSLRPKIRVESILGTSLDPVFYQDDLTRIRHTMATTTTGQLKITVPSDVVITSSAISAAAFEFDAMMEMGHFKNVKQSSLKQAMRQRITVVTHNRGNILKAVVDAPEQKARNTLRDMISEKEWRRYVTNGFIMVKGASGKYYQIFNNKSHTIVWHNNKKVKELCIVADSSCPPTDHVLTIKTMVQLDEQAVWDGANQYNIRDRLAKRMNINTNDTLLQIAARCA